MKKKLLVCAFFIVGALLGLIKISVAQTIDRPYDYPIRPGMEEWNALQTAEDRYGACQIPEKILSSISTVALAETCLNFPLFLEVNMASTLQKGFHSVVEHFNGLQELFKREDAGKSLISIYEKMNVNSLEDMDENQKGNFSFNFTYIELVIFQDEIVQNLSREDSDHLRDVAIKQFVDKQKHAEIFGSFGLTTTALILGKLVETSGQESVLLKTTSVDELDLFLSTMQYKNENIFIDIFEASKKL